MGILWEKEKKQKILNQKSQKQKTTDKDNNKISSGKITKRYSRTFKINNKSSEPINPEDISITVNQQSSPPNKSKIQKTKEQNFIQLTIFWSHYQAYQKGLLKENIPLPWELHKQDTTDRKWKQFLNNIIDKDWTQWINDANEVKKRSLKAINNIEERTTN